MAIKAKQRGGSPTPPRKKTASEETLDLIGVPTALSDPEEQGAALIAANLERTSGNPDAPSTTKVIQTFQGKDQNQNLMEVRGPGLETEEIVTGLKNVVKAQDAVKGLMGDTSAPRQLARNSQNRENQRQVRGVLHTGSLPTRTGRGTPLSVKVPPFPNRATAPTSTVDLTMLARPETEKQARQFHFAKGVVAAPRTPLRAQIAEAHLERLKSALYPPSRSTKVTPMVVGQSQPQPTPAPKTAQPPKNSHQRRVAKRSSSGLKP